MKMIRVADLKDYLLDYYAAVALGTPCKIAQWARQPNNGPVCWTLTDGYRDWFQPFHPSSAWHFAAPLLTKLLVDNDVQFMNDMHGRVQMNVFPRSPSNPAWFSVSGIVLPEAISRAFVASRLGIQFLAEEIQLSDSVTQ